MLKSFVTATAVSALMIASASAQSTAPDVKTTPPAATATPPSSTATSSTSMQGAQIISQQQPDQWVASNFKGTDVIGPDNEKVGDVSDVLFDQNGQVIAYIVSVGGFLGMGAKEVALPPSAFQIVSGDAARPASRPATTGAGSTTPPAAAVPASDEKKLKIAMTKDQLKEAANFEYYKEPSRAVGTTTPGAAPRPLPGTANPSGTR